MPSQRPARPQLRARCPRHSCCRSLPVPFSAVTASTRRRSVEFLPDWSDPLDPCGDARWLIGGEEREVNDYGNVVIFLDDLEKCTATDLQAAMRRARRFCEHGYDPVVVAVTDENFYDKEILPTEDIRFELIDNLLTFSIVLGFDPGDDERDSQPLVRSVLDPLLRRHRMTIVRFESQEAFPPGSFVLHTSIGFNTRERTLQQLYDVGQDAEALFGAMHGGQLTRETAGDLIRSGHANVLIGQPEGHWLEVKRQHYDLRVDAGKIKLAESVSRFCNAEDGGLVIYGMASKKVPNDVIRRICPLPRDKGMVGRYRRVLQDHLHPPPDNLRIEAVDVPDDGMLILIDVPPQPEELKPFLVHGAVVDGKAEREFISIVRRQGDETVPITAPMIHSMLAAGRALLRRGELPRDS
jgi:hypothetical protein